jgi:hypothetical protein
MPRPPMRRAARRGRTTGDALGGHGPTARRRRP